MNQIAAVVEIAMRARAAGLEMADSAWSRRFPYIEYIKALAKRFVFGAAPARRDSFEARDHLVFGDLDLDRPGLFRPGNERAIFRRRGVGDVEHTPAAMPEMGDIKIPATVHFLHRQFK